MDLSVVNLSDFELNNDHIQLLKKGLSFSPTSPMNEFEVFKDISLFLRKVLFKLWHNKDTAAFETPELNLDKDEKEAIDNLISLLDEDYGSDSEINPDHPHRRPSTLRIRSTKMPILSKHKWLQLFLDQVKCDLRKVNWEWLGPNNLTSTDRPFKI